MTAPGELTYGSLCTGIRGLDLAVERHYGAVPAWCSEIEPALVPWLAGRQPDVPNLGDLTTLDWSAVAPVDILTAGYPCQPFSHAGNRKGTHDPRHLWPHVAEAVRVLRPRVVLLENVAGHLTLGFGDVLRDLAAAGFDAEWCVLRASDVGAPHQRARLFVVATDADRPGLEGPIAHDPDRRPSSAGRLPAPDPRGVGWGPGPGLREDEPGRERRGRSGHHDGAPAPDADGRGLEVGGEPDLRALEPGLEASRRDDPDGLGPIDWGVYRGAVERWELILGRRAPHPVDDRGRLSPPFVEWMMGYPAGWVEGLSRTQSLKALGNAVVTQQALGALAELAPTEVAA